MIGFSGLVSGLDTQTLINAIVSAQRGPISQLQNNKVAYESQISKLGKVSSALEELGTFLDDNMTLTGPSKTGGVEGTNNTWSFSSRTDVLSISSAVAPAGGNSYEVNVNSLASAEESRSASMGASNQKINKGTLTFEVDGAGPIDLVIDGSNNKLDLLAADINTNIDGVTAELVDDGAGSFYMKLTADNAGHTVGSNASDAIKITESYTETKNANLDFFEFAQASNASFTIDGEGYEQQSNSVSGEIAGLSFDLLETGASIISVEGLDPEHARVQEFIDKVNGVLSLVQDEVKVTAETNRSLGLAGDSGTQMLKRDLRSVLSRSVSGITETFQALSQLGIRTDENGLLSLDADDLDEALSADPDALDRLFTQDTTGIAAKLGDLVDRYTQSSTGVFAMRTKNLETRITRADDSIDRLETRLDRTTARLERQFLTMEQALANLQSQSGAFAAMFGTTG